MSEKEKVTREDIQKLIKNLFDQLGDHITRDHAEILKTKIESLKLLERFLINYEN